MTDVEGDIIDLLQRIRRINSETEHDRTTESEYIGYGSELTILALFCHQLNHSPGALRAVLPTRKEIDMGSITEDGAETGIDYAVFNIMTCQVTPLQVKTADGSHDYREDILVVSAIEIAGGSYSELLQLQSALVAQNEGRATRKQRTHINRASSHLIETVASKERGRLANSTESVL